MYDCALVLATPLPADPKHGFFMHAMLCGIIFDVLLTVCLC